MPNNDESKQNNRSSGISRRQFLKTVGVTGAVGDLALQSEAGDASTLNSGHSPRASFPAGPLETHLKVNGKSVTLTVEPRTTLLNALRNHADPPITGPKLICDEGACGGCTVLMDGRPIYSCLALAVDAVNHEITTTEGLADNDRLTTVQQAFVEHDALMCGFCTPGFVLTVTALLRKNPNPTRRQVQEACSGNICRCGTYPRVFEAAIDAARQLRERSIK